MSRFTRVARSRVSGQHDVGHEGVITGGDGFSLRSSIADPQGVAQPPLQSPNPFFLQLSFAKKANLNFSVFTIRPLYIK
ncbi:hypothetical protein [Lysinibacillus sp. NPDC096212]|uniref:hypothetical protein n=1 Tax=unclassified Lysinibacillus TaxID=2636778 RepID=UPI00382423D2